MIEYIKTGSNYYYKIIDNKKTRISKNEYDESIKNNSSKSFPTRYIPNELTNKDKIKQKEMLEKSSDLYKKHIYYKRNTVPSFHSKTSNHIVNAKQIYKVDKVYPNEILAKATGCEISALKKIVSKGQGAYFSSGSRPNQSPQSWGLARLASSITGGKAAAVDFSILEKGCNHNKKAYKLALESKEKYNKGRGSTDTIKLKVKSRNKKGGSANRDMELN